MVDPKIGPGGYAPFLTFDANKLLIPFSSTAANLWDRAHGLLNEEDRVRLSGIHPRKLEILQEVLALVSERQNECMRKRWKFRKPSGEQIIVRDLFAKMAQWIAKLKEAGDMAAQYDPAHAALPWAGIRILLQVRLLVQSVLLENEFSRS